MADIVKSYAKEKDSQPIIDLTQDAFDEKNPQNHIDQPDIPTNNDLERVFPEGVREGFLDEVPEGVLEGVPEGVPVENHVENRTGRPKRRNVGTYKDGPANIRKFPIEGESYEFAFNVNVISDWEKPIPAIRNRGGIAKNHHPEQKVNKCFIAECYLLQEPWFDDPKCIAEILNHLIFDTWDSDGFYFNEIFDPRLLAARANSS